MEAGARQAPARLADVNLMGRIDHLEERPRVSRRLGAAEPQEPTRLQRVMKQRQNLLLEQRLHVDQHIPAADEVHPGKRRIPQHIVPREDAPVAQRLADPVSIRLLDEELLQALRGDLRGNRPRVDGRARRGDPRGIQIRRKDLDRNLTAQRFGTFHQRHRHRIGLLPGRAAQRPHPQRVLARTPPAISGKPSPRVPQAISGRGKNSSR